MLNIPIEEVRKKILESGKLSESELDSKIKNKLKQLSGLISKEGAAHIIANELGIKLIASAENLKIKSIVGGMNNVEIVGKVVKKYELRHFENETRKGKVGSFLLGDETGVLRIVLWNDLADKLETLKENDVLKIKSAYARDQNGRKELHLNDRSKIIVNPEGVKIGVVPERGADIERKSISELKDQDQNVELLTTIVQVYDLRFYEVCPDCNKRIRDKEGVFSCEAHGNVTPSYAYVLNCFIDDGSDNMRCVFFKNQVINLLGITDEQILKFREDSESFDKIKNDLLGNIVKIRGRAVNNEVVNRIEFIAQFVDRNPDPKQELEKQPKDQKLKTEVEETSPNQETTPEPAKEVSSPEEAKPEQVEEEPTNSPNEPISESSEVKEPESSDEFNVDDDSFMSLEGLEEDI